MSIQAALAFLAILGQIFIVLYIIFPRVRRSLGDFSLSISFIVALSSTLFSLYFSEIVGWEPCVLCWYQRIAMYPLVVIFAIGVWKQDYSAKVYGLALSLIGFLISVYQIYLQVLGTTGASLSGFCSAVGAADCSVIYMLEFGYITFPVMSATAFLIILVIQLFEARDTIGS